MTRFAMFGAVLLVGCTAAAPDEVGRSEGQAIVGVDAGAERPEVGRVYVSRGDQTSLCTGTLVTAKVVLTSAHCFDEATPGGWFRVERDDGYHDYPIADVRRRTADDIAIALLAKPVPAAVAVPAPLATRLPVTGEPVTTFGYGCTDRFTRGNADVKRKASYTFGDGGNRVCFGDSGGPTFDAKGAVLAVTRGFYETSGIDVLVPVEPHFRELTRDMIAWNADACAGVQASSLRYPAAAFEAQGLCVTSVFYCNPFQDRGDRRDQDAPPGYRSDGSEGCSFHGWSGTLPYMWQQNFCKPCDGDCRRACAE